VEHDDRLAAALATYLTVVDECAPGLVEGLYVVGSAALGDWVPGRSDVDIVAVTAEPATDDDAATLRTAHALLAERLPVPSIDGPYLAWGDLITPPMGLHRPWSLDGEFRHDGDCFELNPVTWYVLARHGLVVRGPSVERLGVYVETDARVRFCVDNLAHYWVPLADDVERALDADPTREVHPDSFEWCALGALRLHRTAFHGDVVSKTAAAVHGRAALPDHLHSVVEDAVAIRHGRWPSTTVDADRMRAAVEVVRWCTREVSQAARPTG
jgi:hypothetical protein